MQKKIKRTPDFEQFLKVLKRKGNPGYLPFYEHYASAGFMSARLGTDVAKASGSAFWRLYVDFWLGLGFDCIPMEIPLNCPLIRQETGKAASHGSEACAVIKNRRDFEIYPWPDISNPIDFKPFEIVAELLPEGVKIVGGVCMGPYEWISQMMGVAGLSYALYDDPALVAECFEKIGILHHNAVRQIASMDAVGALRQGDDLGYKTSTFLEPELLRKLVFPTYKKMVDEAHKREKPFILHSCGNLREIYEDLIDDCKIDAKHSFEDAIIPVSEFKKQYGDRITPLGGLDVDFICRRSKDEIRVYARDIINKCFYDGYWALGTGNSLTDYMPVENYLVVLEEGMNW